MNFQGSLHGSQLGSWHSGAQGPLSSEAPIELPFAVGEVIAGKYEVIGLIGSGGMGYVVSARHVELGELVAIKFLRSEALAYEELVMRFAREARAAVRIKSEHVARVYDVGNLPNGIPFIVMEHLEGKDLGMVLQEQGRLPIKVAVEYVMQACEALASAHSIGIVHRDVKPENLFLARHGQSVDIIKVLDFGISKVALSGAIASGPRQFVRTTMPIGSPIYMSPEQIRSSENVDARTDIWSLGCVLFELITGKTAFDAPTLMELGAVILGRDPTPLRALVPEAPPELEALIQRCLQKDPTQRVQSIAELGIALYPFAPRRARISAERCHSLLKSTDPNVGELDFASVAPPSQEAPSLRNIPTLSSPASTSTPISIENPDIDMARPRRRGWVFAAMSATLGVGGFLAWPALQGPVAELTGKRVEHVQAAATPVKGAELEPAPVNEAEPTLPAEAPRAGHEKGAVTRVQPTPVASTTAAAAVAEEAENATDPKPRKRYRAPAVRPVPVPAAAPAAAKPRVHAGKDEPDVGF